MERNGKYLRRQFLVVFFYGDIGRILVEEKMESKWQEEENYLADERGKKWNTAAIIWRLREKY